MLNSHQILAGARTKGGIKTYVGAEYVGVPTAVVNGGDAAILDITGDIELDGVVFALGQFDSNALNTVLVDGEYILAAVPAYDEPVDRTAAEAASLNYYVGQNALGESTVSYFLPSAIEASVAAAGGHNNLAKARAMGSATPLEIQLLNEYEDQLARLSDPRYTGQLLEPVGVKYVCKRIFAQDNRSKVDALVGYDNQQIELFLATQGYVAADRKVDTVANQSTAYDTILAKIKRAFIYANVNDANADVNGTELRLDYANGDTLGSPVDLDGAAAAGSHIAVFEYFQPTYMSRGHEGTKYGIFDLYEVGDSAELGRINPLYMARDFEVARVSAGRGMPLPALTKYAYPLPIARFTKADGPVLSNVSVYTPGRLDLV